MFCCTIIGFWFLFCWTFLTDGKGDNVVIDPDARIIGGKPSPEKRWPFMASLRYRGFHFCGAAVWDEWHVITAAHCVCHHKTARLIRANRFSVYLGHTRVDNLDNDYEFSIDKILIHKYYDGKHGLKFDIAILRLSRPIDFDDAHSKVKCVCQPEAIENLNLGRCMTMGWGSTVPVKNQMAIYTDDLLEVDIPVLEDRKCLSSVADFNRHWHICAMTTEGGRDSCEGDSGGSFVCPLKNDSSVYSFVGITSFGDSDCGRRGVVGVYTRVHRFLYWIEKNTAEEAQW